MHEITPLNVGRDKLTESDQCDTAEANFHVFSRDSVSMTQSSYPVRVVMCPGLVLLS